MFKYQKPREDWSRALLWHVLTCGITGGRTTFEFWPIFHKDFFLAELFAILLWVSLDFQLPWHLSSQDIKRLFRKSYVYEIWLTMIHYSLDSGCWLFQPSGSWASNKASTVESLAFSEVSFGKFSFVMLQPFSFKHSLYINLVNSQFLAFFVKLSRSLSIAALTGCFPFPLVRFTAGCTLASCFSVSHQFSKPWRTL